jgi:hypothetical protein
MIEPVDAFPCRLFVERRFEYSKRLIWWTILPAALIRRATPKAASRESGCDGSVQAVLSNSCSSLCLDREKFGETQPGESFACHRAGGTQSAIEAIAAYWLQSDNRRSTFVSFQPAFSASAQANIAARPVRQNASDHTAAVSACSWMRWIGHDDVDPEALCQMHGRSRVDAIMVLLYGQCCPGG